MKKISSEKIFIDNISENIPKEKRLTYLLLTIFLGVFGIHKFYIGKIGMGILYLFTGGLFLIGWIIDIINAIKHSMR